MPFPEIHHAVPGLLRPGRRKQAEAQREQMWAMLGSKAPGELTFADTAPRLTAVQAALRSLARRQAPPVAHTRPASAPRPAASCS